MPNGTGVGFVTAPLTDDTVIVGLTSFGTDTVRFNIADAIPPAFTFVSPAQRNPLLIGDSTDITIRVTDNVALDALSTHSDH